MNREALHSPASFRTLRTFVVLSLVLPGLSGCVMVRGAVPPGFDTVSLEVDVDREGDGQVDGDLVAYTTLKGMLVGTLTGGPSGAVAGGAGGAAFGSVACAATGPFIIIYPVCVFGMTLFGGMIGGGVGLFTGGVAGAIGGLPGDTAEQVTEVLGRLEADRSFDDQLMGALQAAIPREKQVDGNAEGRITANLHEVDLDQHSSDHLSIELEASMVQEWRDEGGKSQEMTCKYRYESEEKPAQTWLANGDTGFRDGVSQAIDLFARWMNRDLEAFAAETELPETGRDPASCFRGKRWYHWF